MLNAIGVKIMDTMPLHVDFGRTYFFLKLRQIEAWIMLRANKDNFMAVIRMVDQMNQEVNRDLPLRRRSSYLILILL